MIIIYNNPHYPKNHKPTSLHSLPGCLTIFLRFIPTLSLSSSPHSLEGVDRQESFVYRQHSIHIETHIPRTESLQIIQWLFKVTHEQPKDTSSRLTNKKESSSDEEAKSRGVVLFRNEGVNTKRLKRVKGRDLGYNNSESYAILFRRDRARACFYHTLNLRRLGSFHKRKPMKMKKEDIARGLGIGLKGFSCPCWNKVLPISDTTLSSSTNTNEQWGTSEKKERIKGDKTKAISRMKELFRWAAATMQHNIFQVLHFRNRGSLKPVPDDDQLSNDSPKISFRWEVESCCTTSSAYSAISMASSFLNDQPGNKQSISTTIEDSDHCTSRAGNWITTDSGICGARALRKMTDKREIAWLNQLLSHCIRINPNGCFFTCNFIPPEM
ncbi:hypothetical protein CK203_104961 [Vitis vinifera]|uniref:Uncharacterized protein n=1 Tax=Vitis vinifera TaxID=29760 RepID=A0A438BQB1_VITVI|nr:hypothetical protein CK203_104961 [Vitis vinifera]